MRKVLTLLLAATTLAGLAPGLTNAATLKTGTDAHPPGIPDAATIGSPALDEGEVTLRVAPTITEEAPFNEATGYVIPSQHWLASGTLEAEAEASPTTPAIWLQDPADPNNQHVTQLDGVAGCSLDATDPGETISAMDLLDHAEQEGCIDGWDAWTFDLDPFIVMVDGLWKNNATTTGYPLGWWMIQKNGHLVHDGISTVELGPGDTLDIVRHRG